MSTSPNVPRVDRRARRRAETRARLLEAARATFARQGIDATRINEITDEADVGFGSFYNYFESKDAIVAAVVEETVEAAGRAIDYDGSGGSERRDADVCSAGDDDACCRGTG